MVIIFIYFLLSPNQIALSIFSFMDWTNQDDVYGIPLYFHFFFVRIYFSRLNDKYATPFFNFLFLILQKAAMGEVGKTITILYGDNLLLFLDNQLLSVAVTSK